MSFECDGRAVKFEYNKIRFRLTATAKGVWRLQSETDKGFDNMGAAQTLANDLGEYIYTDSLPLKAEGNRVTAPSGDYAEITDKTITFYDCNGTLRRVIKSVTTGNDKITVKLSLDKGEKIYGTGERFNKVNQRGKKVHIYAIDKWCRTEGNSYVPTPLLISSQATGIFMNRYEHSVIDIGRFNKNAITIEQRYAPVDLYIFMSDGIDEVLKEYSTLTGFAPMPPQWNFGTHVCRYHPEFEKPEGVFAMIDAMKENDFPWDSVILEGFRPYNKDNWPALKEISERVHGEGKHVLLYEQCGRFPRDCEKHFGITDEHAVSSDNGYYLKETRSMNLLDNFHHKDMRCVDLTSEKAKGKYEQFWQGFLDMGVEGAKIDFCEQFPDKPIIHFADGRDPMAAHHWYPTLYNILRYRQFGTQPEGGMNFSRGGGIGAQRYPFIWAGDQRREFYFLKVVIKAALSCGLSGIPFVSWDMAGYQPGWIPYDRKHEDQVFLRGLEFTAFSPCIQTHGRVKRPYDFDEHTKALYRAYSKLHECLKPYLMEQADVATKTGLPLMRHLCLWDSEDAKCLDTEDEYMLGCGLLVAPILTRGQKRNIYLPKGRWTNIFTGEKYEGPRVLKSCKVPLEAVPVFMAEGADSKELLPALENAKEFIEEINKLTDNS